MSMFTLKEYSVPGKKLPITALPVSGLVLIDSAVDEEKSSTLKNIIEEFRQRGDPILQEFASLLSLQKKCTASIVMTSGVPAPYDAWTGNFDNLLGIFFNLDQWSISDLENQGLAVLKHELAHLIMAKHLQNIPAENFVDRLEQIVLDEGIAHFIGFPRGRGSKDSEIDFSDIPELTDEQLSQFKRRGRPVIGESPRKAISIRIDEGVLDKLKSKAKKTGVAYQSLINEILKKAI